MTGRHTIQRQVVNLQLATEDRSHELQEQVAALLRDPPHEVQNLFDRTVGPDRTLRIEHLELDLGDLRGPRWPTLFRHRLLEELRLSLQRALTPLLPLGSSTAASAPGAEATPPGTPSAEAPDSVASFPAAPDPYQASIPPRDVEASLDEVTDLRFRQLLFFLAHGRLPWWGGRPGEPREATWVETLLHLPSSRRHRQLGQLLRRDERARRRLIHTVADGPLDRWFRARTGLGGAAMLLQRLAPPGQPPDRRRHWRERFWQCLLRFALEGSSVEGSGQRLVEHLVHHLVDHRHDLPGTVPVSLRETESRPLPPPWQGWLEAALQDRGSVSPPDAEPLGQPIPPGKTLDAPGGPTQEPGEYRAKPAPAPEPRERAPNGRISLLGNGQGDPATLRHGTLLGQGLEAGSPADRRSFSPRTGSQRILSEGGRRGAPHGPAPQRPAPTGDRTGRWPGSPSAASESGSLPPAPPAKTRGRAVAPMPAQTTAPSREHRTAEPDGGPFPACELRGPLGEQRSINGDSDRLPHEILRGRGRRDRSAQPDLAPPISPQAAPVSRHPGMTGGAGPWRGSTTTPQRRELSDFGPQQIDDEAVYLEGAGAILLHPFLQELFTSRGLLDRDDFRDEACRCHAVHLLARLAHGDDHTPEYDLLLPKLVCGMPWPEPLPASELGPADHAACDELLLAVLTHWQALRSSSPVWLRQQFFERQGKLENVDQGWKLTVQRHAQDVLLTRLPWGLGLVRLCPGCKDFYT